MNENLAAILDFVETASGLSINNCSDKELNLFQREDSKVLTLSVGDVENVLSREDSEGQPFIQVDLKSGQKLLVTDTLIGFRPAVYPGLNMNKLPIVVTTPDLIGVIEALEDTLSEQASHEDLEVLKKLFFSVLGGAESIGFDLSAEKKWLRQINRSGIKASA